eukprot:CAMPEP_0198287494 /NCGR_PEP_ID=MMETSP1449-20131203/6283_1 /TAXON_ID=420275 /ORGANISM="Attheya septentrionalis, Strain CCMP2084" /LENGTH=561 /DNA_ID=CAMNT_0043985453 /DNA_START=137 /DNA_END=1822 /DNA_ORIENTATION=-
MAPMMGKAFAIVHGRAGKEGTEKRSSSTGRRGRPPSINTHFDASDAHPHPKHPVSPHGLLVSPQRQVVSPRHSVTSPRGAPSPRCPSPRMPPSPRSSTRRGKGHDTFHFDSPISPRASSPHAHKQPSSPNMRSPRRRSNSSSVERDMTPTSSPRKKTPQHFSHDGKSTRARSRTPTRASSESRNDTTSRDSHHNARDNHNKEPDKHKQIKVVYNEFGDDPRDIIRRQISSIPKISAPTDLIIQVEASSISINDCIIRKGLWLGQDEPPMLPLTPGFDVVGTIILCGELARGQGFKAGQRVAGLVRTGGNARFCVLSSELCVRVPGEIDSDEAVCLTSTFVTAYQALNMGKSGYNLKGAKILLLGGPDPIFQAMIEMAMLGGASIVYTVTPPNNHAIVKSFGAKPLPIDKRDWLPIVQGQIDICIDSMCEDGFESPRAALNTTGKLVCIGMTSIINSRSAAEDTICGVSGVAGSMLMASFKASYLLKNTFHYDLWKQAQEKPAAYRRDLQYMFQLLLKDRIQPNIWDCVGLNDVAHCHEMIEKGKAGGALICIPWKKHQRTV